MGLDNFVHMAECVKICQHFGLGYAVWTSLQACSSWKLAVDDARPWGGVWPSARW